MRAQHRRDAALVRRIAERPEQSDPDRLHALRLESGDRRLHVLGPQGRDLSARHVDAFAHLVDDPSRHERRRAARGEVVPDAVPADAGDDERVAEPPRRDEAGARALSLDDEVPRVRRPVGELRRAREQSAPVAARGLRESIEAAAKPRDGIALVGERLHLKRRAVRPHEHAVGERAADVDADEPISSGQESNRYTFR